MLLIKTKSFGLVEERFPNLTALEDTASKADLLILYIPLSLTRSTSSVEGSPFMPTLIFAL